jgi:DNA-binding IclR family transcriptional regulator
MLGSWFQHNLLAGAGLVTQLEALNQSLGECVVLGMRNGLHVQFVHVMQSLEPVRYYIRPGANRPLLQSALGKMILSRMPDEEIRRLVLRYNNERSKDMPAFETRVLLKEISVAREQGFFETRNLMSSGIGMIAMLIPFNISNRAVGLGIGAPVDRLEAKRKMILNMMREAIAVLSLQNNNVCEAAKVIEAPRTHSNDKSRARKKRLRP